MATLQKAIAEQFLVELEKSKDFDAAKIKLLKELMASKKIKPDDLVRIFTLPAGSDLA